MTVFLRSICLIAVSVLCFAEVSGQPKRLSPQNTEQKIDVNPKTISDDQIKKWISDAARASDPPIMFGSDFGLYGPAERRYPELAVRAESIINRFSSDKFRSYLSPSIQGLIKAGPKALPHVHAKVKASKLSDPALKHLIIVLGETGNSRSIDLVVAKLKECGQAYRLADAPGVKPGVDKFWIALIEQECVVALAKRLGRLHIYNPDQWETMWTAVKPYYAAKKKGELDRQLFDKAIKTFVGEPGKESTRLAREQLVVMGRKSVPWLLDQLEKVQQDRHKENVDHAALAHKQFNLCWTIDELGSVSKLSTAMRMQYFEDRFVVNHRPRISSIEQHARFRALYQLSLAQFCELVIKVDSKKKDSDNMIMRFGQFFAAMRLKYYAYTRDYYGTFSANFADQHRRFGYVGGLSREEVTEEVKNAAPILTKAIRGTNESEAYIAARIADYIGMITPYNPDELIKALRDRWLENTEQSGTYGSAMVRFKSPIVTEALRKGLFSEHDRIVRTSANYANKERFPPNKNPKIYAKLVELIDHESESMRFAVVRTLRNAKPELLKPFLHKLAKDTRDDVVVEVCYAIDKMKNPMFAEVLVEIAMDESRKENVRATAIGQLDEKYFDSVVDDILPLMKDKRMYGYVINAYVGAKGKKALPFLMKYVKESTDDGSMATQYLPKLTGKKFRTKAEWLDWWEKQLQ